MPQRHRSAGGEITLPARKIKMSACWMLLFLVGCRLSCATQSKNPCTFQWKTICVPPGHNVSVPCPKSNHDERRFLLFHNEEVIYNYTDESPHNRPGVELHENRLNKTVSFMLTKVNASRYGLYRCEGTFTFPPPFITETDLRILVLVKGYQCKTEDPKPIKKDEKENKEGFPWIWVILLSIACVYGLIISIIAIVIWMKLRGADSQSDYMNTKPKAPRERRKKKGLQNPIPRYF